jgi:hypothetical protein
VKGNTGHAPRSSSPRLLSPLITSQSTSTNEPMLLRSPSSLISPTLPEITTSSIDIDMRLFGASIYTQTGDCPRVHTSTLQIARSNEQRDAQFNAGRGSTEAVTLDGLIEQLITDFSCR